MLIAQALQVLACPTAGCLTSEVLYLAILLLYCVLKSSTLQSLH